MRYRVLQPIGRGGMGEVFLGEDTELERKVALKFLPEALQANADALTRLRREAKAAAALDHPYICKVYEVGETEDGRAFIAMEYVQGETLADRLPRGPLPLKKALRLACEIAEALEAAHERSIVHRDLKPANVMLGQNAHAKVMDFGLAKVVPGEAGESDAETHSRTIAGTPAYMSPEQLRGEVVDVRSDFFGFGIVAQELLTGVHPFNRDSSADTMAAILKEPPRGCDALPSALRALVEGLLSKNPDDRGTIGRARTKLQHLLEHPELLQPENERRRVFVGREGERTELQQLVDQLQLGNGSLVLVGGEPGVGKTRLCEEILEEAKARGALPLTGHCYEMEGSPPFTPWVESLEQVSRSLSRDRFRDALGDAASELAKLMPELGRLYDDIPPPVDLPPEQQRRYLFNSFHAATDRLSRERSIVWLLDDLHWADESSLLLLEFLAQRLEGLPVLFLGTYRDVELDVGKPFEKILAQLVRQRLGRRIALKRLSEPSVDELLQALTGNELPSGLVHAIYHETEGNPFFVEEVFHHLSEEGQLFDAEGNWKSDLRVDELKVPEGIRLVIGRRLQRLETSTPKALTAAAVIGRQFGLNILEPVSGLDTDALYDAIEEAETAQLVEPVSGGREPLYRFTHELIRHTLLSGLSHPKRQRIHLKVADALENHYDKQLEEHAADLSHHLYEAGAAVDTERTIRFLRMAGERALESAAADEAFYFFDTALSLDIEDDQQRADLFYLRGNAYRGRGQWETPLADWQRAFDLYEKLGDTEAIGRVASEMTVRFIWLTRWEELPAVAGRGLRAIGDTASRERASLLASSGVGLAFGSGHYHEGSRMLAQAEELAATLGDKAVLGAILQQKVYTDWAYIHFPSKYDAAVRASDLFRSIGQTWPLAELLSTTQIAAFCLGRLDDVARIATELEPLAEGLDHWAAQLLLVQAVGPRDLLLSGDFDRFHERGEEHLRICERADLPFTNLSYDFMGLADLWRGRGSDALEKLEHGAEMEIQPPWAGISRGSLLQARALFGDQKARSTFHLDSVPKLGEPSTIGSWRYLTSAVQALAYLGENDELSKLYPLTTQAIDTGTIQLNYGFDLLEKIAGIAATGASNWEAAENHFEAAMKQADGLPHTIDQVEVRYWYAKMLAERGDAETARVLLGEAIEGYRRLGMPRHLEIAEELSTKL